MEAAAAALTANQDFDPASMNLWLLPLIPLVDGPDLGHVAAEPRCQCLLSSDDFSGHRGMTRPSSLCKKLASAWQKLEFLDLLGPLCCLETDVDVDGLCFCKLMRKASVCAGSRKSAEQNGIKGDVPVHKTCVREGFG